jgi:ribosomal protein L12E/L44/L45/RPP1/RPP2
VLTAEVVKHFVPGLVDLHSYSQAHGLVQKTSNWVTLNSKAYSANVFRRLGFQVDIADIDKVVKCEHEAIERVLKFIKDQLQAYTTRKERRAAVEENKKTEPVEEEANEELQEKSLFEMLPHDTRIEELRETVDILLLKANKLEQLVKLKDAKITALSNQLSALDLV